MPSEKSKVGRVATIFRYPVKSMRGQSLESCTTARSWVGAATTTGSTLQ